jgi:hypothetical protein
MGQRKAKVLVTVTGGVAEVYTEGDTDVLVVDYDSLEHGGDVEELEALLDEAEEFDSVALKDELAEVITSLQEYLAAAKEEEAQG